MQIEIEVDLWTTSLLDFRETSSGERIIQIRPLPDCLDLTVFGDFCRDWEPDNGEKIADDERVETRARPLPHQP